MGTLTQDSLQVHHATRDTSMPSRIDWGKAVQTAANLAVAISVIALILQIRQTNALLDFDVRVNSASRPAATLELLLENTHLIELLAKPVDQLTPTERSTVLLLGYRALVGFEQGFSDVALGLVDESGFARRMSAAWYRENLNYGMPFAWAMYRERADPAFVAWVEANIIVAPEAEAMP